MHGISDLMEKNSSPRSFLSQTLVIFVSAGFFPHPGSDHELVNPTSTGETEGTTA